MTNCEIPGCEREAWSEKERIVVESVNTGQLTECRVCWYHFAKLGVAMSLKDRELLK